MNALLFVLLVVFFALIITFSSLHTYFEFLFSKVRGGISFDGGEEKITFLIYPLRSKNIPQILIDEKEIEPTTISIIKKWLAITIIRCDYIPEKIEIKKVLSQPFAENISIFFYKKSLFSINFSVPKIKIIKK
jgi:hypothetical protein